MLDIFLLNSGHFEYYAVRIRSFRNAQYFVLPGSQPSSVLHSVGSGSNIISFVKAFVLLPWVPWKHCLGVSMGLEQWDVSRTYVVVQFSKPLNLSHACTARVRLGFALVHAQHQGTPFFSSLLSGILPTLSCPCEPFFPGLLARKTGFLLRF